MIKHLLRRKILAGWAGLSTLTLTVLAQDTNVPTTMKPVVITGSLIPTAETVGPAPVETISSADIERIGATDVLDLVKRLSPSFSGNGNFGQTVNNGGFGEAYVSIRNLPTLVMLNGRRLGNSSFSASATGTSQVDINTIPLAMIDRVEVLKDGSSAQYGSQAIGGVVNIITKQDFTGTEIGGRYGFATGNGSYNEYRASVLSGITTDTGSFMAGASYFYNDPLLSRDRDIASEGILSRLKKNLAPPSYISPSFPGRVQDSSYIPADPNSWDIVTDPTSPNYGFPRNAAGSRSYVLAGSPFAQGAPGYDPSIFTPPVFTNRQFRVGPRLSVTNAFDPTDVRTFRTNSAVADYNAFAIANGYPGGVYVNLADTPLGTALDGAGVAAYPMLNTTLFGTHSIQSQDRRQVFANGHHDLIGKEVQLFGQFLFANTESVGALAPSPVISLVDPTANIVVPGENVYNPFGIDLGPGGASDPRVRSRFVQSGNRIFDAQTDYYHFVAGLKGEFEGGYDYNAAYTYNRSDQIQFTKNAINGAALDAALTPNSDPARAAQGLSALKNSNGDFVPMYNIFFTPTEPFPTRMGPNDPSTINAIKTTLFQSGTSEEWAADALIRGQPFDVPAGKIGFAVGGGFRSEFLETDFDGLTKQGKAPGLNPADPTSGRRDSWAGFAEVRIPITSPDMNVPALHALEVIAAGRYETFDPGGDSAVPKVMVRWQPIDEQITLRGSYSQSFVAPDVYRLFGGRALNNPFIFTSADGAFAQESTVNLSNPNLEPVDAENYGAGIVLSPKFIENFTVSVDYYHVQTENDIFRLSSQAIVNDLEENGASSPFVDLYRDNNGNRVTAPNQLDNSTWGVLNVPLANGSEVETEGLDFTANYVLPLDRNVFGRINLYAAANLLLKYTYKDPLIGGPFHYEGQYTDTANGIGGAQGLLPDWQINMGLVWDIHDFTFSINARYVPEVDDLGTLHGSNLEFEQTVDDGLNDFTVNGKTWTIDSWFSIDMQLAYELGRGKIEKAWYDGLRLAIGANNITDQVPPIIASSFEDNTDKSTYDILGRFIYFEVSKKF